MNKFIMFHSARLKLTAWYIGIILLICLLFSMIIYTLVSRQIEQMLRHQNERLADYQNRSFVQLNNRQPIPNFPKPPIITAKEIKKEKFQLIYSLLMINLGIVALAGCSGYFLSGRTLLPIHQMMEEQNEFIANASHELRTPIATLRIEMESSLLEKKITDQQARRLIKSNLEELAGLQTLTNNLLRLSPINQSTVKIHKEVVSVTDCIKKAKNQILPLAKQKNIKLILNKFTDFNLTTNHDKVTEILTIFLDNAVKYSQKGTKVNLLAQENKTEAQLSVSDQGPGISEADLPHLFTRFWRADKARSQNNGHGLGLSIAKKLATDLGGEIVVINNKETSGTTFTLKLPIINS